MSRRHRMWNFLTLAALLAGCGIRIYAAWTLKHLPWRDATVPMLMAKHMARGEPMPTFYYGQAYMGSLESWFSAQVMRVLGPTPFAACLGTVLLACVALCLTVWMARVIGGVQAGFWTALLMMATSDASLYLSAHTRGGYMVMLVCGLGVVALMSRILKRIEDGTAPRFSWELPLAGLLAGVGWWNLQLVVVYLLAAVLAGIPHVGRLLKRGDLYAAVGTFLLGATPWIRWNLLHGGDSLGMSRAVGAEDFEVGVMRFAERALDMMGWNEPAGLSVLRVAAGGTVLAAAWWWLCFQYLSHPVPSHRRTRGLGVHLWVLMVTLLIYSFSHFSSFNTSRYLLPLYPSFTIVAGVVLASLLTLKRGGWLAAGLCGLILAQNNFKLHKWDDHLAKAEREWNRAERVARTLEEFADGIALGGPMQHWVTFASNESAIVTSAPMDVYAPYNRRWATVEKQAVLDPERKFAAFLQESGAEATLKKIGGLYLYHSLRAPSSAVQELKPPFLDPEAPSTVNALQVMDRDIGTYLEAEPDGRLRVLTRFQQPVDLIGLCLPAMTELDESRIQVWGEVAPENWVLLKETAAGSPFFWSGNRLVHMGMGYHRQLRWSSQRVSAIRLEFSELKQPLREVKWLIAGAETTPVNHEWVARQASDVVGAREVVDGMHFGDANPPRILRSSFWERRMDQLAERDPDSLFYLPAWKSLDVVVSAPFVESSRDVLQHAGLPWQEQEQDGHMLFKIGPLVPENYPGGILPIAFTEHGLLSDSAFELNRWSRAAN